MRPRRPGGTDGHRLGAAETHAAPNVRRYRAAGADQTADQKKKRLEFEQGNR